MRKNFLPIVKNFHNPFFYNFDYITTITVVAAVLSYYAKSLAVGRARADRTVDI